MAERQPIGAINGKWAVLFKAVLVIVPVTIATGIAWGTWVTKETLANQTFRLEGDRYTPLDAAQSEARIMGVIAELPPQDWRERITAIEKVQKDLEHRLDRIEIKQERILTILQEIRDRP